MRITSLRRLRGPNIYLSRPIVIARLELGRLTGHETTSHRGFADRLTGLLPGLVEHHCSAGEPGGFLAALRRGTYFGHVTEHVTLELSHRAGRTVNFGRTVWAGSDGSYDVIVECPLDEPRESRLPAELFELAMRVVIETLRGGELELTAELARLQAAAEQERLGVSTAALASAARVRGIPVTRIGEQNLLRLGHGCHRHLVWAAMTDLTSVVGADIASDKMLTKALLAEVGVPVPEGTVVTSAAAAVAALQAIGPPVVIKPRYGNHGAHVSVRVTTQTQARQGYSRAAGPEGAARPEVIVEPYIEGTDYRVLVVDGQVVAAAEVRPAHVTGDGRHDIATLIDTVNADPRRGEGHSRPLTRLALDDLAIGYLTEQGHHPGSVPAAGEVVWLCRNANLSTGGTSRDVTSQVHPQVAELCRRAAAAAGLDVCGVDLRLADIAAPPCSAAAVIEINASPGLRMHVAPAEGTPRDVAGAIIDRLYPPGTPGLPGRIPIVSVTGTNGKTSTVRMIGHILRQAGLHVGTATTDGIYHDGQLAHEADASGPLSAEMILANQATEAAVLETARGGIVRRGLGYDQADVAVVTNITADHLGCDGVDSLDDLTEVKALVAERIRERGHLVLNADDPRTVGLATRAAVRERSPVLRYFTLDPANQVTRRHLADGGLSYELRDARLVEVSGADETVLLAADQVPGTFGGIASHVLANALACAAACRALGVTVKDVRRGLATFLPAEHNPGRGAVYRLGRTPVIVDYAHNPAAVAAIGRVVADIWGAARAAGAVAAITLPGDRHDDLVAATAAAVASAFGRVVVYEDENRRGRAPGAMTALITATLKRARPGIRCRAAAGLPAAVSAALALATPGDPVLLLYEKLGPVHALLAGIGATPWAADRLPPGATASRPRDTVREPLWKLIDLFTAAGERPRDHGAQDVVRALADRHQRHVAVQPLHRELGRIAIAAVHLHRGERAFDRDLGREDLGHAGLHVGAAAFVPQVRRPVGEQPGRLDLRRHVGELQLHRLEAPDRLAERLSLSRVPQRLRVRLLGHADRAGRDVNPADLQRGQHLLQAAPLLAAKQRRPWHPNLVQHDLAGFRAVVAELGQVAHDLKTWRAGRDEKHRHAAMRRYRVGVGLGQNRQRIGVAGIGDPHLPAGDHIIAARRAGDGLDALQVGSCRGFGQSDPGPPRAGREVGQVIPPLALRAVLRDHPAGQGVAAKDARHPHPAARDLLEGDRVRHQVSSHPAELLGHGQPEQAHLPHLLDDLLRVRAGGFHRPRDRADLAVGEGPHGLQKQPLLRGELEVHPLPL